MYKTGHTAAWNEVLHGWKDDELTNRLFLPISKLQPTFFQIKDFEKDVKQDSLLLELLKNLQTKKNIYIFITTYVVAN